MANSFSTTTLSIPAPATVDTPAATTDWTAHDYPMVMVGLSLDVREQAIEMANALRNQGLSEQRAIALSVVRACDRLDATDAHPIAPTDGNPATGAQHIVFEAGAWQVVSGLTHERTPHARRFGTLDEALRCAHTQARDDADAGFYVYVDQAVATHPVECFGRRWLGGPALFHVEPWEGGWTVRRIAGDSRFFESLDDPDHGAVDPCHSPARRSGRWLWERLTANPDDDDSRESPEDAPSPGGESAFRIA